MIVDIQFSSARNDWPRLREAVLAAEAEGYDTTWVFDHFDGSVLGGDRPLLECFTLLGAMADCTSTIGIGSLVTNMANRHPAVMAAAASSVQRISGGRMRLGLGAGAGPESPWAQEHHDRGIPLEPDMHERHRVFAQHVAVMRATDPTVPIVVGVNSNGLARIAGEIADGVNVRLSSPSAARLAGIAKEAAGDRPFEVSGWCFADDAASREKAEELGVDRLILTRLEAL